MKWGERRWQNEDGSLTPEGRVHYGYGEGGQTKEGAKLEKYATKQHAKYDKYQNIRQIGLGRQVNKKKEKFDKNQSDKNKAKYIKALQDQIEDELIGKLMHDKIDNLDVNTWRQDRNVGIKAGLAKAGIGNVMLLKNAILASKKGLKGVGGSAKDLAKYANRISDQEYADIKEKARDMAIKKYSEQYHPNEAVTVVKVTSDTPKTSKNVSSNAPYWEKYSQGSTEYKQAQSKAEAAEKPVFKAEKAYFQAEKQYGKDSPQAEVAKRKYLNAYNSFENKYGYSPQERD